MAVMVNFTTSGLGLGVLIEINRIFKLEIAFASYNCASDMRADFWTKSPQQKLSDIAPKG